MKKVLITGGAGYIGSVLVGDLLKKGFGVRVLDRFMFGGESLLGYTKDPQFEIVSADIRDRKIVAKSLESIDAVVHLAALVGDPACKVDERVTREINFLATKHLVDQAMEKGVKKFVYASTCSNYGVTSANELASEDTELNPLSLYAETKIASEEYVQHSSQNKFKPVILRFATIFGLSPRMRFNLMLNEFAREATMDGSISVINGDAFRPYLHVDDASSAISLMLVDKYKNSTGIFNVVGENIQKKYLAKLSKKLNKKVKLTFEKGRLDDKRDYAVSSAKFQKHTGWEASISVEQGFKSIVKAIKNGMFLDPYEPRFNDWIDEKVLKEKYL